MQFIIEFVVTTKDRVFDFC